jgi:hypothetical protein
MKVQIIYPYANSTTPIIVEDEGQDFRAIEATFYHAQVKNGCPYGITDHMKANGVKIVEVSGRTSSYGLVERMQARF